MNPLSRRTLLVLAFAAALIGAAATAWLYRYFVPMRLIFSAFFWLGAVVCALMGTLIRSRISDGRVGFDRSQFHPIAVTYWMLTGQAVATVSSLFAGGFGGMALVLWWRSSQDLAAARADLPATIVAALAATCATIAGVYLERSCMAPPQDPEAPATVGAAGA